MESLAGLVAVNLGIVAAAMFLLWLVSLALRDASIVDIFWGPGFALIACSGLVLGDGFEGRRILLASLVTLWGLRLGGYLLWRNAGHGEDRRYQAMRRRHGDRFPIVSLYTVFGLQAALMWFVSLPVQVAQMSAAPAQFTSLDALGLLICLGGLAFESIGDWQLARFKADPANDGQVMDRGLWAWTRHPNYFGDCLFWWGIFAVALTTPWGFLTVASPAAMTFLLMRVSGVALLERGLRKSKPGWKEYAERTPAFFPAPPRSRS